MSTVLSPVEASFLEWEDDNESDHMHLGAALVLQAPPSEAPPSLADVRALFLDQIGFHPRLRQRLSVPRFRSIARPRWEPDPNFQIDAHLRQVNLPPPGREAELWDWLGDFFSTRLDRSRPLWDTRLIHGLEGERWALVAKGHHALVDGVGGASILDSISPEQDESFQQPVEGTQNHQPSRSRRRGKQAISMFRLLGQLLSRSDPAPFFPKTSLNRAIGKQRRLAAVTASLEDLRAIRASLGGTVNDVVLAATAGGLRRFYEHRREPLPDSLRVMVPVNTRVSTHADSNVRVSLLHLEMPLAEPDALLRYRGTVSATSTLKAQGNSQQMDRLVALIGASPPIVERVAKRISFRPHPYHLLITNIPGAPERSSILGSRLEKMIPVAPLTTDHALAVAAIGSGDALTLGMIADRDSVDDLTVLQIGIETSLEELRTLAAGRYKESGRT